MAKDEQLYTFRLEDLGQYTAHARAMAKAMQQATGKGGLLEQMNQFALNYVKTEAAKNLEARITEHGRPRIKPNNQRVTLRKVIFENSSHEVTPEGFRFMVQDKVRAKIDYAFSLEYGDRSQIGRDIYFLFLGRSPTLARDELVRLRRERKLSRSAAEARADVQDPLRRFNRASDNRFSRKFSHRPSAIRSTQRIQGPLQAGDNPAKFGATRLGTDFRADRILGPRELGRSDADVPKLKGREFGQKRFQVTIRNPVPQYRYGRDAGDKFAANMSTIYGDEIRKRWKERFAKPTAVNLETKVKADAVARKAAAKAAKAAAKAAAPKKPNMKGSKNGRDFGPVTRTQRNQ